MFLILLLLRYSSGMKHAMTLQNILFYIRKASKDKYPYFIAIDGRSGTGKSTIAQDLAHALNDAVVVDQDDFYEGGDYETWKKWSIAERVERTIDWKRLKQEVLDPLAASKVATWHPYDWDYDVRSTSLRSAQPAKFVILEGTYSARKELEDLFDISILVEVNEDERKRRLLEREGDDFSQEWDDIWRAAEDHYFNNLLKKEDMTFIVDNSEQYA